jgi:hypothetical protein
VHFNTPVVQLKMCATANLQQASHPRRSKSFKDSCQSSVAVDASIPARSALKAGDLAAPEDKEIITFPRAKKLIKPNLQFISLVGKLKVNNPTIIKP